LVFIIQFDAADDEFFNCRSTTPIATEIAANIADRDAF